MASPKKMRRHYSYPIMRKLSGGISDNFKTDLTTADEMFPMRVPLETVQIGQWKYISSEFEDIELLYEFESSNILVSTNVRGSGNGVPALFRLKSISAADLTLVSVIPGSLESMVARLILETDQKIPCVTKTTMFKKGTDNEEEQPEVPSLDTQDLDIGIIKITASVHESGHLRDMLLILKCNYQADINPDSTFIEPCSSDENIVGAQASTTNMEQTSSRGDPSKPRLTFVECLPHWVVFIPWMFYSRKTRKVLQLIILLYTTFTVCWALWQLYRHVHIIRIVMQPITEALKFYLSSVVEIFDWVFSVFTIWWHTYLSPLNVLGTLLFTPIFNLAVQFKTVISPFQIYLPLSQLLQRSGLVSAIKSLFYVISILFFYTSKLILSLVDVLMKPSKIIWQSIQNSQIAVASLDFNNMRIRWIFSLVTGSIRTIVRGLFNIVGYQMRKQQKKAMTASATSSPTIPTVSPALRNRRVPMATLYKPPVTKQK